MATSVRLIRRYVWLIDTIRQVRQITLEEINRRWLENRSLRLDYEGTIPERTFHRHREAISDIFGIEIQCNRYGGNTYYIANEEALRNAGFTSWLFNGLAIYNQLTADESIAGRIFFDCNAGGEEFLSVLVEGMIKKRLIELSYRSFNNPKLKTFIIEPYGLKQSGRRWYLISHIPGYETLTVFALDRTENASLTECTFDYDRTMRLDSYFEEVIGVNLDEEYDCEEVRLRVYGRQRNYIESLPLHISQKKVVFTKEFSEYCYKLRPEYEFQHEILKMGADAEVLSPQWLRDHISQEAAKIIKRYRNSK